MHTENAMKAVYTILMVVMGFVILVPCAGAWSSAASGRRRPWPPGHVTLDNWVRAVNIRIPAGHPHAGVQFAGVRLRVGRHLRGAGRRHGVFLVVRTDMPYGFVFAKLGHRAPGVPRDHRRASVDPASESAHRRPQRDVPGGLRHPPVQHLLVPGDGSSSWCSTSRPSCSSSP